MIEGEDSSVRPLKVVGIIWNTKDYTFKLDLQPILNMIKNFKNFKSCVLQTAAKIFDPVGFVSPFNLIIKCLLQEIWENGLGRDDELPTELKKRWEIWCSQIYLLKDLKFERKYFSFPLNQAKELELHIFSDASPRAFGSVSYFRYVSYDGRISTSFITAKSRVAPLKKLTLPRSELMGAVIAARILRYLKLNLNFPISRMYLCSDSLIALHWIKGAASKWKPFFSNRVIEIQSNTDPANWHHCSGKDKPADYISRGAGAERLMNSSIWIHGPEWLRQKEENWPKGSNCKFSPVESGERRIIQDEISTFLNESLSNSAPLLDVNKYRCLNKLLRVTSWVFRFIHYTRNDIKRYDVISAEELDGAENYWRKTTQGEVFAEEIAHLKQGNRISKLQRFWN
ncbi:hypothetical protein AVEN_250566-1 [Araneus ventricosus]|uniref:Uncharacterized protein n=1 Tax=Araneus ventricosus TaxID=182803 RepID=A0A4Y2FU93_ARAVE|nr:hypothetical protein AVEN_250566-1 [Araneus ventricosus]